MAISFLFHRYLRTEFLEGFVDIDWRQSRSLDVSEFLFRTEPVDLIHHHFPLHVKVVFISNKYGSEFLAFVQISQVFQP